MAASVCHTASGVLLDWVSKNTFQNRTVGYSAESLLGGDDAKGIDTRAIH
jgi:hypothetical protein